MRQKLLIIAIATIFSTNMTLGAKNSSPTLKKVMQDLERDMANLGKGIFYQDFKVIKQAADNVAHHPRAKDQLPTVMKTLKTRLSKFKKYDTKVHEAAKGIMKLAEKEKINEIVKKQEIIVRNCVGCHNQFRDELSNVLSK